MLQLPGYPRPGPRTTSRYWEVHLKEFPLYTRSLLFICALGVACPFAHADEFTFSASGAGFSANGTITATASGTPGLDNITDISGEINNSPIAGLATGTPSNLGPYQYVNYFSIGADNYGAEFDNLFYTTGAPLDIYGVGFTLGDGSVADLYEDNGTFYYLNDANYTAADINNPTPGEQLASATIAATPEPSSLLLLATGALGLLWTVRRKLTAA